MLHLQVTRTKPSERSLEVRRNQRRQEAQGPTRLFKTPAEPLKHPLHVSSFLHGYDPGVILLIDPNQEVLLIVVPESWAHRIKL